MNLTAMKLMAPLVALATAGIVTACGGENSGMAGDDPLHDAAVARDVAPDTHSSTVPTPSDQVPNAPPEIMPPPTMNPEIPTQPQTPDDATSPTAPTLGSPPN